MNQNIINIIADDDLNIALLGEIGIQLAEPLNIIENNIVEREAVPRNTNYFEETIPLYMDDLFKEHFRMSRSAVDVSTSCKKNCKQ